MSIYDALQKNIRECDKEMGRTIYLSEKEITALTATAGEWGEMMNSGDEESRKCTEERMENGLGSALKKLHKGRNGERIYKDY